MAEITLRGNPTHTVGQLPAVGQPAPAFTLTGSDLSDVKESDYAGRPVVLNIFPSIDTQVCATSVRTFNERVAESGVNVLCVSQDLPFAAARFCAAEGIEHVKAASTFRSSFGSDYGVTIADGPLAGLMARSVVVIDGAGNVAYTELVPEIGQEPNYDGALDAVSAIG
jgi:thiol peroxidase